MTALKAQFLSRCFLLLLLSAGHGLAAQTAWPAPNQFGDYDSELRGPDKRVDTERLAKRLSELGVNTYYWLIWHRSTDWDDLKLFLPSAAKARIAVWAYLVPPTEGPPGGYPASEPFGLDYPKWAEEIARLSLAHTNLTGWVIDDFYVNHELFTPAYLKGMQARAKELNPRLSFLPLMYFPEITRQFVDSYRDAIDGVVVAYPNSRDEINEARAVLNGEPVVGLGELGCDWHTTTTAGDLASARTAAEVLPGGIVKMQFRERDSFTAATTGYHFKQLLLDEVVVWEEDVAGGSNDWHQVKLEVPAPTRGKTNVMLAFRLLDKKGVSNFGVRWRLKELRADGLRLAAGLDHPERWRVETRGPLEAGFGPPSASRQSPVHIPFIVMTAGSVDEFKLRHGEPTSPERMADWLKMCLLAWRDGRCDGVVTYCLDKTEESRIFPLARHLFQEFSPKN